MAAVGDCWRDGARMKMKRVQAVNGFGDSLPLDINPQLQSRAWLFQALHKATGDFMPVYDVKEDERGIRFLTCIDGVWAYRDAQEFAG